MAYRIDPAEPVAGEIRRVLRDQLDRAIGDLRAPGGPDAEAIHDARRRIKKARSALRLSRALFGGGVTRLANAELRDVARSIARQRDADARVEAVDRILERVPSAGPARDAIEEVRRHSAVASDEQRSAGSVDASLAHRAARRLQQTSDWLQRVPIRADGWEALEQGLRREYRRGRRQLRSLGPAPGDDDRHDWRKRAKDLWYHERLLKDLWPAGQKPYVRTASALAEMLGDDHDLSLVRAFVEADDRLGDDDRRTGLAVIDARRRDILEEARALGDLVYADRPEAWVDRHGTWWAIRTEAGQPEAEVTGTGVANQARSAGNA